MRKETNDLKQLLENNNLITNEFYDLEEMLRSCEKYVYEENKVYIKIIKHILLENERILNKILK